MKNIVNRTCAWIVKRALQVNDRDFHQMISDEMVEAVTSNKNFRHEAWDQLEEAIEREIDRALDGYEVEARNIRGLDDEVEELVTKTLDETDFGTLDHFDRAVASAVTDSIEGEGDVMQSILALIQDEDFRKAADLPAPAKEG